MLETFESLLYSPHKYIKVSLLGLPLIPNPIVKVSEFNMAELFTSQTHAIIKEIELVPVGMSECDRFLTI